MAEIASAFVQLLPSARGFGSKLDSQISGEVSSSGKRSGSLFGSAFGGAFKAGGVAAAVPSGPLLRVSPEEVA